MVKMMRKLRSALPTVASTLRLKGFCCRSEYSAESMVFGCGSSTPDPISSAPTCQMPSKMRTESAVSALVIQVERFIGYRSPDRGVVKTVEYLQIRVHSFISFGRCPEDQVTTGNSRRSHSCFHDSRLFYHMTCIARVRIHPVHGVSNSIHNYWNTILVLLCERIGDHNHRHRIVPCSGQCHPKCLKIKKRNDIVARIECHGDKWFRHDR